jgi:hypothetical protein
MKIIKPKKKKYHENNNTKGKETFISKENSPQRIMHLR